MHLSRYGGARAPGQAPLSVLIPDARCVGLREALEKSTERLDRKIEAQQAKDESADFLKAPEEPLAILRLKANEG